MINLRSVLLIIASISTLTTSVLAESAPKEFWVYFGTYTGSNSQGIYRSRFDATTGRLSPVEIAAETPSPSFLALHPSAPVLYALNENNTPTRQAETGLSAFAINPTTGALTLLNRQPAGGSGPAHVSVDRDGKSLLVAHYGSGQIAAVALQLDGRLGALGSVIQHTGSSVNPQRQAAPHAHSIYPSPDNRFALAADLGLDRVLVYRLDSAAATLVPNDPASASLPPGSGPRHLAFHPNGRFVYVINEMLCTVAAFRYEASSGRLTDLQNVSTLPPGEAVQPNFSTAEIHVHPSGTFLFGSNRGHNSIVVFAVDSSTGQLTYVENQATLGRTPRHFALDPTGGWLLAENQDTRNVAVFRIDAQTGKLTASGPLVDVPTPVCAVFVPIR